MHSLIHGSAHSGVTRGHVLGSPRLYDFLADVSFMGRRRATFLKLISAAGVQTGQRVLDVGSGTGYFARLLADAVGPSGKVTGIDPSREMTSYASRKAVSVPNCTFQVGAAEALDFPSGQFDVVVSSLVLHHLPQDIRPAALDEMRRVLRAGGKLLIAEARTPADGLAWRLLARVHGIDRMAREVPDLATLATHTGFSELDSGEAGPWLRYLVATSI